MNKKGFEMSLRAIVELFLVVIIIFATIVVFANIYKLFFSSEVDPGTLNSFNRLSEGVEELISADDVDSFETSLMIAKNYVIVGFDKNCSIDIGDFDCPISICESGDRGYNIPKPRQCRLGDACLCLFREDTAGDDFENEKNVPKACVSFSGDIKFLSSGVHSYGGADWKEGNLVLYGKCEDEFGIRQVYVSEEKQGDLISILVSTEPFSGFGEGSAGKVSGGGGSY